MSCALDRAELCTERWQQLIAAIMPPEKKESFGGRQLAERTRDGVRAFVRDRGAVFSGAQVHTSFFDEACLHNCRVIDGFAYCSVVEAVKERKGGTTSLPSTAGGGPAKRSGGGFFPATEDKSKSFAHPPSKTTVHSFSTWSVLVRLAARARWSALRLSALYSFLSKSDVLKTGGVATLVETEIFLTAVVLSARAAVGMFTRRNEAADRFYFSGEMERGATSRKELA